MPTPNALAPIGYVAAGGALGSVARWALSTFVAHRFGSWPYGTFLINISGCFLIGLFLTLTGERASWPEHLRWLISIGFIGGYTTFSSYEYETYRLFEQGRAPAAIAYVTLSTALGLIAVAMGAALARKF